MDRKSSFKYSSAPSGYLDEFMQWQQGGAQGPLPDFRDNILRSRGPGGTGSSDDLRVIMELLQRMIKPGTRAYKDFEGYMGKAKPPSGPGDTWGGSYEALYQLLGGGQ